MPAPRDWSSYDTIASRYEPVWGSRFAAVARLLWDHVSVPPGAAVLDVGTGTGIVLQELDARGRGNVLAGCDRSAGMIRVARSHLPAAGLAVADAAALPFPASTFDVVTASFVLSHLRSCEAGLGEAHRVLQAGGIFAMTSWAVDTAVHVKAWRELLAEEIPEDRLRDAVNRVAPSEARFETAAGVRGALIGAVLRDVEVHPRRLSYRLSLEEFLADRALSSAGRFASDALGPEAWRAFLDRARGDLGGRFGSLMEFARDILIGLARRGG